MKTLPGILAILPLFCFPAKAAMPFVSSGPQSAYYADRDCVVEINAPEGVKSISWNLKAFSRTAAAGQTAADSSGKFKISFHFPPLNDGVIASATLTCIGPRNDTILTKELNFFPANPFENSIKLLDEQKIELFEADGSGNMAKLLNTLKVPFSEISGLEGCSGKILIISGIDMDQYSGLQQEFQKLMQGTRKIIVINPSGTIPLSIDKFDKTVFANNSIVKEVNKKLDTCPALKTVELVPSDNSTAVSVSMKNTGSTYCLFTRGKSELYILSWDIAGLAQNSPAPVYILSKLLINK